MFDKSIIRIGISSNQPGVGVTTLATVLAATLADQYRQSEVLLYSSVTLEELVAVRNHLDAGKSMPIFAEQIVVTDKVHPSDLNAVCLQVTPGDLSPRDHALDVIRRVLVVNGVEEAAICNIVESIANTPQFQENGNVG